MKLLWKISICFIKLLFVDNTEIFEIRALDITHVFGYFAGRRGAGCSLRGAGCNLRGAGHDLRGVGCEMLSLILELQTCQLGLRFAHVVTKMPFSRLILLRYHPHSTPPHSAPRKPRPTVCM